MKNIADNTDQSRTEISGSYRTPDGKTQIDFGITYRNGYPEYTSSGHFNGSSGQCLDAILEAYPDNVMVQDLHARWSKFHLQDVSKNPSVIDKTRRGAENFPAVSFYETQAQDFLSRNWLKFRATLSDSKTPAWAKEGEETGHHYRVTISRPASKGSILSSLDQPFRDKGARLVFDFWGSVADARKMASAKKDADEASRLLSLDLPERRDYTGRIAKLEAKQWKAWTEIQECHPSAYDVLACISSDAYTPETFADFCAEYGYESDSIKALQTYRRVSAFAKRLRAFFTADELTQLSEIQ